MIYLKNKIILDSNIVSRSIVRLYSGYTLEKRLEMFKISEFSRLVRVSARMLRYYESNGLFEPGWIDEETGYRYYQSDQIKTVLKITTLRDYGFSVQEIKDILPTFDDAQSMKESIEKKKVSIKQTIEAENRKLHQLDALTLYLQKEQAFMIYDVELKSLEAVNVISLRDIISHYNQEGLLWQRLGTYVGMNRIPCLQGSYSLYLDNEYKETDPEVEVSIAVETLGESSNVFIYKQYPEIPLAATVRFSGVFDGGFDAAHGAIAAWMEANNYTFAGQTRSLNIVSPEDDPNPENWLTELQIPVAKQ